MKKLIQVLEGNHKNHILPFLWVHGEPEEVIRTEIQRIHEAGIGALCVEPRPHMDFGGPQWFSDLAIILDECKKNDMKMWLLDDSHFPTGYANGEVKKNHPELRKKFLILKTFDFIGPIPDSGAILKYALHSPDDQILGVFLQRRTGFEEIDIAESFDLTNRVCIYDDYNTGKPNINPLGQILPGVQGPCTVVRFDLPEGEWSLNVLIVSFEGGEKITEGYLNPIDPAATQILLDTVYQPVYDHFAAEFGNTFMGFFSDEPRFGNIHGAENASIGRNSSMVLPWKDGLEKLLAATCDDGVLSGICEENICRYLPLLFIGDTIEAHALRYTYMDLISRLYSENFDGVLAQWCHEHNCMHIGHVIEDNNAVARLGYGTGHFFRSMANADMAGIDVVHHQLMPGFDRGMFKGFHKPGWDGEFFTYMLGKLGGSLAHLDPQKHGRCMCELFGAYGWAEGSRLEKWLLDYMLVRGINELVPHAFDPAPFPHGDCPPHFYAQGHNPQYPEFRRLMCYGNRLADLLSEGTPRMDAALLFHAEAEWSGEYMLTQRPAAVLGRAMISYDIVTVDHLLKDAFVENETLKIHIMSFKALIVPYADALPRALLEKFMDFAEHGLKIYFVDGMPKRSSQGIDVETFVPSLGNCVKVVPLGDLAETLFADDIPELRTDIAQPYLRVYHYSHSDGEFYFFVNEHPSGRVRTTVRGGVSGHSYIYDAFDNTLTADPNAFTLDIPPYGSRMVVVTAEALDAIPAKKFVGRRCLPLTACTVALASMTTGCTEYGVPIPLERPGYVSTMLGYEDFSGRIRYSFIVDLPAEESIQAARLILHGVREGAGVYVNGMDCGVCICPDYVYDVGHALKIGKNHIVVELNTTLGRVMNDFSSQNLPMEPTGLTGAVLELA